MPTDRPIPPTYTPVTNNIVIPRASRTPRLVAAPDSADYLDDVQYIMTNKLGPALETILEELEKVSNNPELALDDELINVFLGPVSEIYLACDLIEGISSPPANMEPSHAELVDACADFRIAGDSLLFFIEDPFNEENFR